MTKCDTFVMLMKRGIPINLRF